MDVCYLTSGGKKEDIYVDGQCAIITGDNSQLSNDVLGICSGWSCIKAIYMNREYDKELVRIV